MIRGDQFYENETDLNKKTPGDKPGVFSIELKPKG